MLVDSHCHLDTKRFDADRAAVLGRARDVGVERFVTIGCDVANSARALGLAQAHADVFCSAGVHPHEADKAEPDFIDKLRALAAHPRCVAIGECGLDYYYDHSARSTQRDVFRAQIRLARALDLPLVVHVRDAWDDCLEDLRTEKAAKGVIHCFSGERAHAEASLALGFYISIPGIVTFKNPGALHEVVPLVPDDRLLVETDSPYLAPAPHRGKRNEPGFVRHVAEKCAALRGVSVEALIAQTGENARRLFQLP